MEEVLLRIKARNDWWGKGTVHESERKQAREGYLRNIFHLLGNRKVLALVGLRRTGKTTLMLQTIDHLLKNGTPPEQILYVLMEDVYGEVKTIDGLLLKYKDIANVDLEEQTYILIDEIHLMENWQMQLKSYYESGKKIKFIVCSSSSTLLYKDAAESLVGRIQFIPVAPLSFGEFLTFHGMKIDAGEIGGLEFGSLKKAYLKLHAEDILRLFKEYMNVGGFPEWFEIKDREKWKKTLAEEYLALILYRDVVRVFKARDPILLESLTKYAALHSSSRMNYSKLAKETGSDMETVKLYLSYLATAGLIQISNYYTRGKTESRKERKMYFGEAGLMNALYPMEEGKTAETIVAINLLHTARRTVHIFENLFYWKNKHEVDCVSGIWGRLLPVEVKYRESASGIDGLLEFMEEQGVTRGIVVTKATLEKKTIGKKEILFVPAWLFLLALDRIAP